ncbi:MAG TPA: hypothetical protein VH682_22230 [Gemmataceae bacterium]
MENGEVCLEQLQAIETGWGPESELALLRDLLTRSPGCADPLDVPNDPNSLARFNAYKHRLHALRCDYVNARLRVLDVEDRLTQSRLRGQQLENHVKFLEATLDQMRATLTWRVRERCRHWWWTISEWLRLRRGSPGG